MFTPLLESLGEGLRTVVVSYPATGPQTYRRLTQIADEALPVRGPLVLLGESFSGPIAVSLAARHPNRVIGLVLCCTFLKNPRPSMKLVMALAGRLPAPTPPLPLVSALLLGRFRTPALVELLGNAIAAVPAAALRQRLRAVTSVDVSGEAKRLSIPVLYLRANEDRLVPAGASKAVQSICPQTSEKTIAGPHCLLQAVPSDAATAVRAFVAQTSPQ